MYTMCKSLQDTGIYAHIFLSFVPISPSEESAGHSTKRQMKRKKEISEREGKIDRLLSRSHPPQPSPPFFLSLFPPPPPLSLPTSLPPPTQADFPWSQRDQYSQCRWCTNHERWCTKEERTHSVSIMLSLQKSAGKNH